MNGREEQRYKTRVGERLARALSENGYASRRKLGAVEITRACDAINTKHLGRRITPNMMRGYIFHGKTLSLEVAAVIARGLGIGLPELAYDDKPAPTPKRRRRPAKGLLDGLEGGDW